MDKYKIRPDYLVMSIALALAAPTSATVLEEITVTSQKREQNLQDVGVAVTAFSNDKMKDIGLKNSNDLGQFVPNVEVAAFFGNQFASTFIRGSGKVDFNANSQTTVGVYLDEVYLPSPSTHSMSLFDIERIEVLRGPQGTLYGRNATAGAINYISAKPEEEFAASITAGIANFDGYSAEGYVTGSFSRTVRYRLAATTKKDDGWMENRLTGDDGNDTDSYAWRAMLEWSPTDEVDILFSYHKSRDESLGFSYQMVGTVDPATFNTDCSPSRRSDCVNFDGYQDPDGSDNEEGDFNLVGPAEYNSEGGAIRVDWSLSGFDFTSITAYEEFDRFHTEDADASPGTFSHNLYSDELESFSQEFRLSSNGDGALSWIVGAYYAEDELPAHNLYNFFGFWTEQNYQQDTDSAAAYANFNYDINDAYKLTVGLRYTKDEVETTHESAFVDDEFGSNPFGFAPRETRSVDFTDFSWKVALDYKPNEDWLIYGSISKGYKSGGINTGFGDPLEFNEYDDEQLISYEVGFKSTLWGGSARFNGAIFYYDYEDLQVFDFTSGSFGITNILDNADEAEYYGAEFEFITSPIDGLGISFSLGLLETEFTDFTRSVTGESLNGNQNTFSPELKASLLMSYEWEVGPGRMGVAVDTSWTDEAFHTVTNSEDLAQDSHFLVGGRLSFVSADDRWEVAAWGRNLNNEEWRVQSFDFVGSGFITSVPNRPRSFGVDFTYRWE